MFFVDFEATEKGEIISVGLVGTNRTFHSFVKPQHSELTPFIKQLTGITEHDLKEAPTVNYVFHDIFKWLEEEEKEIPKWQFCSYGEFDKTLIMNSMSDLYFPYSVIAASVMATHMEDASKMTTKFFKTNSISLLKAFNYLKETAAIQHHNALEDAQMLRYVYENLKDKPALSQTPAQLFTHDTGVNENKSYNMPHGKFYCKMHGGKNEREFENIEDAIDWVIDNLITTPNKEEIHRDRIAIKIMKACRGNNLYFQRHWRRVKDNDKKESEN